MSGSGRIYCASLLLLFLLIVGTGMNPRENRFPGRDAAGKTVWAASLLKGLAVKPKAVTAGGSELMMGIPASPVPELPDTENPPVVKGIYMTSWVAGNAGMFQQIMNFIDRTEINSVVVDVKDDEGRLSYVSQVPLSREIGSGMAKFDPRKVLATFHEHKIYPIARIVVFKDPILSKWREDLAVRSTQGGIWHDFKGLSWVDPYNKAVWEYNVDIAKEAAALGFKEIQFDYVRFTSDGMIKYCKYPAYDGRIKADVIRDFLKYAYQELNPLGVKVSADVFGLVCSASDDLGIGQVLEKIGEGVDVICPMVYPSHYYKNTYGIADPDQKPYETIMASLTEAKKRLDKANLPRKVVIRAWLQDFSLVHAYGRSQLLAQIKAVGDSGYEEWIFWNPSNRYEIGKYRLKSEVPAATPTPIPLPTPYIIIRLQPSSTPSPSPTPETIGSFPTPTGN